MQYGTHDVLREIDGSRVQDWDTLLVFDGFDVDCGLGEVNSDIPLMFERASNHAPSNPSNARKHDVPVELTTCVIKVGLRCGIVCSPGEFEQDRRVHMKRDVLIKRLFLHTHCALQ